MASKVTSLCAHRDARHVEHVVDDLIFECEYGEHWAIRYLLAENRLLRNENREMLLEMQSTSSRSSSRSRQ